MTRASHSARNFSVIDHTHDAAAKSWVASANGHAAFPLQNLPLGVFTIHDGPGSLATAIGDQVFNLTDANSAGLLPEKFRYVLSWTGLWELLELDRSDLTELRHALFALLAEGAERQPEAERLLIPQAKCKMLLPTRPPGYTDFYAGIHHAENVGKLFRPDAPLLPNYKYVPIGYHGRTSTVCVSGEPVRRPKGQLKRGDGPPEFAATERLDYEVELGLWVLGSNALGEPIPIAEAGQHLAGVTLLNDWSARDIQAWEYQPLGPFLAKNFMTSVSPWLVTMDALEPFRVPQAPREKGDPAPLDYLAEDEPRALDIAIEVSLAKAGKPAVVVGRTNARNLYWTPEQLLTHHASNGCAMEPGDLLGTGTISGEGGDALGSLLEMSAHAGSAFLEDGDEVIMTAHCSREGFAPIGFGECRGTVTAS
jgi:fumarylacetoacetase